MAVVETELFKDPRLLCTDKMKYGVFKGPQNNNTQVYTASGQSPSQISIVCQLPSLETLVARAPLIQSQITLKINVTGTAAGYYLDIGKGDSLAAFPLHALASTISTTINSNTNSINMTNLYPALLKMFDHQELSDHNSVCPVMPDNLYSYNDGYNTTNNPLSAAQDSNYDDLRGRGSFKLRGISLVQADAEKGLFNLAVVPGGPPVAVDIYVCFVTTEPVLISPFLFPSSDMRPAMYGVANMSIVYNLGDANRVWRYAKNQAGANSHAINSISVVNVTNTKLYVNLLTPHPSDLLPAQNVIPHTDVVSFISPSVASLVAGDTASIESSNLQLNQVPEMVIVYVSTRASVKTPSDSDFAMAIESASVTWNNQSGLLSTFSKQQLWQVSAENGINQCWDEWSGATTVYPAGGVGTTLGAGNKPTLGSFLCLKFGKDIQITEDYFAVSSLSNFNFQIKLNISNQTGVDQNDLQIVVIVLNSGLWVNNRGSSAVYTGLLTKQLVLESSEKPAHNAEFMGRRLGRGIFSSLKSVLPYVAPVVHMMSGAFKSAGMGASGGGPSGAGSSGAGASGGISKSKLAERLLK